MPKTIATAVIAAAMGVAGAIAIPAAFAGGDMKTARMTCFQYSPCPTKDRADHCIPAIALQVDACTDSSCSRTRRVQGMVSATEPGFEMVGQRGMQLWSTGK